MSEMDLFLQLTAALGCLQAVPYSRDYKQKYEYFRKKLKKPVSVSILCHIYLWCTDLFFLHPFFLYMMKKKALTQTKYFST